jgi:hypothetical protein
MQIDSIEKSTGPKRAAYILRRLTEKGENMEDMIPDFNGDKELVKMWVLFLHHNHFMNQQGERWQLTDKGRFWLQNHEA